MQRRALLQLISVGALSPGFDALRAAQACHAAHQNGPAGPYKLRFFTPEENELLDVLMEMIIPADEHSPGAHEAKVSLFADWMVDHSSLDVQEEWRAGLRRMNDEAAKTSRPKALEKAAAGEDRPESDLEKFFVRLKQMTVDGYYTSEIGLHKDLRYQGNEYVPKFSAQGTAGKQSPAAWQQFLADHAAATAKYATALPAAVASPDYLAALAKKDDEAMRALRDKVKVDDGAFAKRALELSEQLTGDDCVTCLIWAAVHGNDAAISNRVVDAIIKDHAKSARLVNLFENFAALGRLVMPTKAQRLLEDVISDNPNAEVRAWAMYVGARNVARSRQVTDEQKQQAADWLKQAETLAAGTELAGRIAGPKFEQEHLQVGMQAPDIAGADIDGVPFKLSDYRGKVVVLDFWGFW